MSSRQNGTLNRDTRSTAATGKCCVAFRRDVVKALSQSLRRIDSIYQVNFYGVFLEEMRNSADGEAKRFYSKSLDCKAHLKIFKGLTAGLFDALNRGTTGHNGTHLFNNDTQSNLSFCRLNRKRKLTIASALVSAKKLLPAPCSCIGEDVERKTCELLGDDDRTLPEGYLAHAQEKTREVFESTSKRSYADYVRYSTLSLGACQGSPRSLGGSKGRNLWSRSEWLDLHKNDRDPFWDLVAFDAKPSVEFRLVCSQGKARGITMNEAEHQVLGPLHRLLYDRLSECPWLCRGEADGKKFGSWKTQPEMELYFISGDYESATDNLRIDVAETILREALRYLGGVHDKVADFALRSLRTEIISSDGKKLPHERGQLMGSLLSFPLLCLQNYIAFTWLVPEYDGVLQINGDDIVWQGTLAQYHRWSTGLEALGLKLSSGKTFIDRNFFSLNSTYFWAERSRSQKLPVVRLGLFRNERAGELGKNLNSLIEDRYGSLRRRIICAFVTAHRSIFRCWRYSIVREPPFGLGVKIDSNELREADLLRKESWLFSHYSVGVPVPQRLSNFEVPSGYRFVTREKVGNNAQKRQAEKFVRAHWETDLVMKDAKETERSYQREVTRAHPYSARQHRVTTREAINCLAYRKELIERDAPPHSLRSGGTLPPDVSNGDLNNPCLMYDRNGCDSSSLLAGAKCRLRKERKKRKKDEVEAIDQYVRKLMARRSPKQLGKHRLLIKKSDVEYGGLPDHLDLSVSAAQVRSARIAVVEAGLNTRFVASSEATIKWESSLGVMSTGIW